MSLADTMSANGIRRKKISVKDVRINKLNFYEKEIVNSLASSIAEKGQLSSAIVFEEIGTDGKKYTLVDGETRYLAICKLMEENKHDGTFDVTIRPKLENDIDVEDMLMDANLQRTKTKDERIIEIDKANKLYEIYKEKNKVPTGMLRRDWIGQKLGLTGRQVQNYLSEGSSVEGNGNSDTNNHIRDTVRPVCLQDVDKALKRCLKTVEKANLLFDELNINSDGVQNENQLRGYSESVANLCNEISVVIERFKS